MFSSVEKTGGNWGLTFKEASLDKFDISFGCNIIFCAFDKSKRQKGNVFKFNLRDIFQWVEHGQIYAVHQTYSVQGIDPHNSQFCDSAQHSRGLKEKW